MSDWREPITDRILTDVKNADTGSLEYQKGALNADDLNRIEGNFAFLEEKLRGDAIFIPRVFRNYEETVLECVQANVLPEGYTQVEYIESSGTQYIDTGFKPTYQTRVVVDLMMGAYSNTAFAYGVRDTNSATASKQFTLATKNDANTMRTDYFGTSKSETVTGFANGSTRLTVDQNKNVTTCNGVTVTNTEVTSGACSYNLYLFALDNVGTASNFASLKLYSCKIYDNETLVRDFIPCLNTSGIAGLYDLVNNVFYANAGTGTFTTGAEAETNFVYELVETTTTYTDWQENNLPWLSEINRIRANYNALVRLFLVGLGLPVLVESNYLDYTEVNNWERFALLGKEMFENMEKEYIPCGTIKSGGDRLL